MNFKQAILNPTSFWNRVLRILWNIVYYTLFRPTPRFLHIWRIWLLRLFGADVHHSAHIYPKATIWAPWNLICEAESCIGDRSIIYNQDRIHIMTRSIISQYSHICTGTHDYTRSDFPLITKPIVIEPDVWIAAGAYIGPGCLLHTGCVIGAYSVVTRSMPAWTVCAGNPCKPIKPRIYHVYKT